MTLADSNETTRTTPQPEENSSPNYQHDVPVEVVTSMEYEAVLQTHSSSFSIEGGKAPSLCIAVIGATGELARRKIFPALFALYYSGFLPEVEKKFISLFGWSSIYTVVFSKSIFIIISVMLSHGFRM